MFAVRSGYWQSLLAPAGRLDVHAEPHVCDLHSRGHGPLPVRCCGLHVACVEQKINIILTMAIFALL